MKQPTDKFTLELEIVAKPRRGRPPKPDAKTGAQRMREFRARKKFNFLLEQEAKAQPNPFQAWWDKHEENRLREISVTRDEKSQG